MKLRKKMERASQKVQEIRFQSRALKGKSSIPIHY